MSYRNFINKLISFSLIKKLFKSLRDDYVILYYHGVISDEKFKQLQGPNKNLFVTRSNFIDQMRFLKENDINVISLDELCEQNFKPKKFSVIISFDDGYKDNLKIAYPILKKYNFPFIIYLIPKILSEKPWVWWLELWSQLEKKNQIFFENKNIDIHTEKLKKDLFFIIKKKMKNLKIYDQKVELKKIFDLQKLTDMSDFFLDTNEVKTMIMDKLITIGSHSMDHLCLKNFKKEEVFNQIKNSKEFLEKTFDFKIKHFSFPYGQNQDISFYEHEILSKLHFQTSVTTFDYSFKKFNKFYLSRCSIGPNIKKDDFERKLLGVDKILRKIFLR